MLKLDHNHKNYLDAYKSDISEKWNEIDFIFNRVCTDLNLTKEDDKNIIWDYLLNDYSMIEFTKETHKKAKKS